MKKVLFTLMCLAAMLAASTSLKAQEVTITLNPGWTWISYLGTEPQGFATALGSFTPEVGDVIKSQWGNATYMANGQWKGSITQFYPGYGYMYKSTRPYPVLLTLTPQQPAPQVVVTTSEPMLITAISAMGGGEVTVSDGTYILVKGLCWATHENPTTNDDFYQEAESGVGSFSLSMTGLNISTTYYVRAYAVTGNGTVYGDQKTFTTRDGIPILTTDSVMDITGVTAICGGNITDNGGLNVTARGVCWSISPNPTVANSHTTNGSGNGSFSTSITGLSLSTTYYVRAYATTAAGTAYGDEKTFTTRDGIPSVTTADVTNIMAESATCGGTVTDNGGLTVIARGVCWSTSLTPTLDDSHTTNGSGNGSFSSSITGLSLNTTYYVRAYATTSAGTGYGEQKTFTTRNGIPTVTTAAVTNIGATGAYSGGTITDDGGGLTITTKGVCWSVSPYPTLADSHTNDGNGTSNFTSRITGLSMNTTYYVRAYVTNNIVTVYGNQISFTTLDDYVYVDLGLPSGTLWATCNVGADVPEDYGDYFAWGETQPKDTYNWSTYQYCNGNYDQLTKYCNDASLGYNGFTDNLTILLPEDDAATANWGNGWRMPTKGEWQELYYNTTSVWTTQNGVNGRLFTASNGNSLFLPAAGYRNYSSLNHAGSYGFYWSSSLYTDYPIGAWHFYFYSDEYYFDDGGSRDCGQSVRAVRSLTQNVPFIIIAIANPTIGGEVNGGGSYQEDDVCTLTATANEGYTFAYWKENGNVVSTDANYTFTVNADRVLTANYIYNNPPTGAIAVSPNQWVYFSQGNLQYRASTNTWRFADNQYDYVGSTNSNISSTYSGWIDLFGWGTSGWNSGNTYYHPWDSNNSSGSTYGPPGQYNLTGSYANADWGVYNPISNGGNTANQWRTLTQPEWNYVFNTRTTTSGIRYAKANVNNVNGVILLPDDWSTSTYSLSSTNTYNASFSSNTITASQWATLESAGAVFLPAAGYRNGTSVHSVGSHGYYWSASYSHSYAALDVYFYGSLLYTDYGNGRCGGQSVRLVRVAEN